MDKNKKPTTKPVNKPKTTPKNDSGKWTEGKGVPVDGKKIKWAGKC